MTKTRLFDYLTEKCETMPQQNFLASKETTSSVAKWREYTFEETMTISKQFSQALINLGIKKGDTISLAANNRPEWNFIDLGCQWIGAILVPLYPTASDNDYQFIMNDAEVKIAFVSDELLWEKMQRVKGNVHSLKAVYVLDNIAEVPHWTSILPTKENVDLIAIREFSDSVSRDDLATIIYTSGTTGNPKGVMLTHKNMVSNLIATETILPFEHGRKSLSFLPLCHSFERIVFFAYLSKGVFIHYAESIEKIGENLKEVKPYGFTTVPRLLEKVYERIMEKGTALTGFKRKLFFWAIDLGLQFDLNKNQGFVYNFQLAIARKLVFSKWQEALGGEVRFIVTGAAPLQERLFRLFSAADIAVVEGYGLTESSPGIAMNRFEPENRRMGTVGIPLPGVEIKFLEDGEILAKGDNIMKGYFKRPDLTAEVIDSDGWLHTGDIGEMVEEKFLKITDRKKELFKTSGGKYVAPQPIENKLKESTYIEQAMLVGDNRKFIAALIVPSFIAIKAWADDNDIKFETNEEAINNPKVMELIAGEVAKTNNNLGHVESIKKFKLLPAEWTIESGELTPTLKVKRKTILKHYEQIVGAIYTE